MSKHTYYIKGMHCASCELTIEEELLKIKGIEYADASLSKGELNVKVEPGKDKPKVKELNEKFKASGYSFSEIPFDEGQKNGILFKTLAAACIAIVVFLFITNSGFTSIINITSDSSLLAFLVFGLVAGVSSCAAMVGGLVLSLSKQWAQDYQRADKATPHILFNLGRLISFALLGFLLGMLGERFQISATITSIMILLVSAVMLVLALQMLGVRYFNRFRFALPKSITGKLLKEKSQKAAGPFVIGFLTFLLPCGFTVVAEGFAILAADPVRGALIMLFFALGTAAPLLAIGLFSTKLLDNHTASENFQKAAGLLIIFFVLYNINFQFGVARYIEEKFGLGTPTTTTTSAPAPNTQVIKSVFTVANDIQPSTFEVKVGQPVRFEVEVQENGFGCMSTIMVPGLWQKALTLRKGQTLVMEFTPSKTGVYQITCAMGVPRGTIKVVE